MEKSVFSTPVSKPKDTRIPIWGESPINYRSRISPRIKSIGWKRFDYNFSEGEFFVNDRQIYTASKNVATKARTNGAPDEIGSNLVCTMQCLCVSCYNQATPPLIRTDTSESSLRSSPHDSEYSVSRACSTGSESHSSIPMSWTGHPLGDHLMSPESDFRFDEYVENTTFTPEQSDWQNSNLPENTCYKKVECCECGKATFVLREVFELCVEADDDDVDLWSESFTASTSASGSGDEDGLCNSFRHINRHAMMGNKMYKPVRWPFRTGFTIWDGSVMMAKFFELCAPTRYPELAIQGRRVLELGAGSGVLGNSLAALGAQKVVMTDLDYILPLTLSGVEKTWPGRWDKPLQCDQLPDEAASNAGNVDETPDIDVAVLNWRQPRASPAWNRWIEPNGDRASAPVEMVVWSDVVWIKELVAPMVDTMVALREALIAEHRKRGCDPEWRPNFVGAFERRSINVENLFRDLLQSSNFSVEELEFDDDVYGTTKNLIIMLIR
eukprot:Selendium_serpulae@DN5822_c0_g1_i1.p1